MPFLTTLSLMTDEPANAEQIAAADRRLSELTADELTAFKAEYQAREIPIFNSAPTDLLILAAAVSPYLRAFLEALGKSHADALTDAVRTRFRKKGNDRELLIGPDDDAAAKLVITKDTPDEARLALLDLDVTADDVRGHYLRWDDETKTWRPSARD
jgi:hypothetical protein